MTLEMKETNNQKELFIVSDEMTNILEHFGKKLVQQKEDNLNKINQLEAYLTITLDEFEQYIQDTIPAYINKEEIRILKTRFKCLEKKTIN